MKAWALAGVRKWQVFAFMFAFAEWRHSTHGTQDLYIILIKLSCLGFLLRARVRGPRSSGSYTLYLYNSHF
jgi:hypothetical protein